MPSLRPLRARRAAVALLAVVALLGSSACGAGRPAAAEVGGTEISPDVVDEIVEAYIDADAETYAEQFRGAGDDTLAMDPVSSVLGSLIVQVVQSQLADEEGAEPTAEERTEAEEAVRTSFVQQQQPAGAPEQEGPSEAEQTSTAIFESLSEDTREWLVDLRADALALARVLGEQSGSADEAARAFYDENPLQFTAVCVYLLAVAEGDLPAVQERLDAGEAFPEVSAEVSVDPQVQEAAGAEPQCVPLSQVQQQVQPELFEALAGAEASDVVGPFPFDESGETVALFEVAEVEVSPFEQVREAIVQQLPAAGDQAVNELLTEELPEAAVRVDPRFGTWVAEEGRVQPPEGAETPAVEDLELPAEGLEPEPAPG